MDEAAAEALLDRLVAWGLVEEKGGEVRPTPWWTARLQVAAEKLNLLAAREGAAPDGNPLVLAVSQALSAENLDGMDEPTFRDAVGMLVVLHLSDMSGETRARHGFAGWTPSA